MAAFPRVYTAFFLWIEPFFTLLGAFAAFLTPSSYLHMTDPHAALGVLEMPVATHVTLRQLGNLYLAFALNEALVLRATTDLRVWRAFLLVLLIADFGHLLSLLPLGPSVYYDITKWGPMDWGNVAFVYCGATTRICFLSGVGLDLARKSKPKPRKSIKPAVNDTITVDASPPKSPRTTRAKRGRA